MGLIYKLVTSHDRRVYVGKTTRSAAKRMQSHRTNYKRWLDGKYKHYVTSFDLLKYSDCTMEVLEDNVPDEMLAEREGHWYSKFDCINKCVPNRTIPEWRDDRREHRLEYNRQYELEHKEERRAYRKQYKQENHDKILEYRRRTHAHKLERDRLYREANRQALNAKQKEKVQCECGCVVNRSKLGGHKKTNRHKLFLSNLRDEVSVIADPKTTGDVFLRVQVDP